MFISRRCWAALGAGVLLAVTPATAGAAFANTSSEQPAPPVGMPGGGNVGGIGLPGTDGSSAGGPGGGSRPADPPGGNSPLPGGLGNNQGNNQNPAPPSVGGGDNPLAGTGLVDGPQQGPVPSGQDQPAGEQQPSTQDEPNSHGGPADPGGPASSESGPQQGDGTRGDAPRSDAPRSDAPRSDAPRSDAPRSDAPRSDAPRSDAPQSDAPRSDAPQSEPREPNGQSDRPGPGDADDQSQTPQVDRSGNTDQGSPDGPGQDSAGKLITPQSHNQKGPLRTGHRSTRRSSESTGHQRTHRQERPGMDARHAGEPGWQGGDFSDDPGDQGDPGDAGDYGDGADGPDGGDGLMSPARI